jgi:hypothetical protein
MLLRLYTTSLRPRRHEAAQKIRKLKDEQDAVKEELRSTTIDQNVTAGKLSGTHATSLAHSRSSGEAVMRLG